MDTKSVLRGYLPVSKLSRYLPCTGRWVWWNEDFWSEDTGEVRITTSILRHATGDLSTAALREVTWAMEHSTEYTIPAHSLDQHSNMLACKAMTVDLHDGKGLKPMPEFWLTKCSPVTPAPSHPAPTWDAFFSWLNNHDEARIEAMYRLLGYFLTGATREQKVYFLYGPGRNGKTVLLELVKHIMGSHAVSVSPLLLVKDQHGNRHPTELMTLRGARLGIMSELSPGAKLDVARMKYLTGGDTICARGMRQDEVNFTNTCKLIAAVNDLPELECSAGTAEKRRVVIIPCANIVPEEGVDPDLIDKLKAEAPGIFAKIIGGAKRYLEGGIQWTQDVADATAEMWEENDGLEEFIHQECERGLDLRVARGEFYQRYAAYRYNSGMEKVTMHAVTSSMKKLGHKDVRGGDNKKYWRNLALKSLDAGGGRW
jgi:putative DNA primase/helicase